MNQTNQTSYQNLIHYHNQTNSPLATILVNYWKNKDNPNLPDVTTLEKSIVHNNLPSGSGIDDDITILSATNTSIELSVPFHPLNEAGFYISWLTFNLSIYPSFTTIDIVFNDIPDNDELDPTDKDSIQDYIYQTIYDAFTAPLQ